MTGSTPPGGEGFYPGGAAENMNAVEAFSFNNCFCLGNQDRGYKHKHVHMCMHTHPRVDLRISQPEKHSTPMTSETPRGGKLSFSAQFFRRGIMGRSYRAPPKPS